MARKSPTSSTLRRLYTLSGNQCAFPGCTHALVNNEGVGIAQICHIEAAEKGGQRYNKDQADEERRAFENLIVLCHAHHKVTDDISKYGVSELKSMKASHEQMFLENGYEIEDSVLDRIKDAIDEKLDEIINQNNQTHQTLAEIKMEVATISSAQVNISTNGSNLYNELLKIGISFRKDNNFVAALSSFQKTEEESWSILDGEVKFKLLANIGATLLDMGRNEEAAIYFLKIQQLEKETLESLAYICLAYAILKQEEQFDYFFEKTISKGKDNENLWLAYLLLKGGTVPTSVLHKEIPDPIVKQDFILIKLLELYQAEGKLNEVQELFWKIEAIVEDETYKHWQIISSYIGLIVSPILKVHKLQFVAFTEKEILIVKKALHLYDRVIGLLENSGANKMLSLAYYNRSLCFVALSREAEGERDQERAWGISQRFFSFKGLFLFHLKNKKYERCELLLEEWKQQRINVQPEERFEVIACEARLLAKKGDFVRLERVLMDEYDDTTSEYKPLILDNLVLNGVDSGDYNSVIKYANMLVTEFPNHAYGYIGLFAYYMRQKDPSNAKRALKEAKGKTYDKRSEVFIWMQLADGFCELQEYQEALVYFEKLVNCNSINVVTTRFAECHYNLENYEKVILVLADKDLSTLDFISLQLLFLSYYNLGLKVQAEEALAQGLRLKESRDVNLFRKIGAQYYSECDHFEEAAKLILAIDDFDCLGVKDMFDLACLLSSMGYIREAFDLAYKLRVIYYETFEAQKYYFDLHVFNDNSLDNNIALYLKKVEENTLVVLKDENGKESKFYLAGDNKISDGVLLKAGNQLWDVLLGAVKGQRILLPNTMGNFEVADIWSNYLLSFRDSLFLLQNKYADKARMYFGRFN
ncbi:hypothetical protein PQ465_02170 [Sphingobacterium oryzagri]|uniref:HNH endonuclease n=1 Tax=Sphingobacterium oryzagri TaxID=3025669 RepID=A0ABY7WHV2_9SPHI|nr:hypothetical protein [Sphingobacterium sp. KACC 22765]WDF69199.1 hypothetical protein PQ465_02170 [Sphingobacterium sp. KACC 22765]